jgi:hypothetical protein
VDDDIRKRSRKATRTKLDEQAPQGAANGSPSKKTV